MKQTIKGALLISTLIFALANCGSSDKKETPETKEPTDSTKVEEPAKETSNSRGDGSKTDSSALLGDAAAMAAEKILNEVNEALGSVRYPDGKSIQGFAYKKWEIPNKKDFANWVKVSSPAIKKGIEQLPAVYSLEVTGHADTKGPEEPTGDKKGNKFYSEQRAKEVKQALVKLGAGFPENRIIAKGAGASNPLPGVEGESALNRRVTFKFVMVEPAPKDSKTTTDDAGK